MAKKKSLAQRMKAARLAAGLSQRKLGIAAGIDAFASSARINRYEQGIHEPDHQTMSHLAKALDVPVAYFYCAHDDLAELVLGYSKLCDDDQQKIFLLMTKLLARTDKTSNI